MAGGTGDGGQSADVAPRREKQLHKIRALIQREEVGKMSPFRIIVLIGVIALFVGVVALGDALAGEKFKLRTVKHSVKWEQVNAGDEEGHVVAINETKGIVSNKEGKWFGDGWLQRYAALFDINPKAGPVANGYEEVADRDGDKYYYRWEGRLVSKDYWEGTYIMTKGTGKFEGIRGKGTWSATVVVPGQFYVDEEWDIELPRR
jgi:hypothetical protein